MTIVVCNETTCPLAQKCWLFLKPENKHQSIPSEKRKHKKCEYFQPVPGDQQKPKTTQNGTNSKKGD